MNKEAVIRQTADYVKEKFSTESTGHDWGHMYRVWSLSKTIADKEPDVDMFLVEIAALLHDIADWKFHNGNEEVGPTEARKWLESLNVEEHYIQSVEDIIRNISFKGARVESTMNTIEGKIVHDADKLDALGAIGIGRAFSYGGANERMMYDPNIKPEFHASFEAYKKSKGTTLNHFYEKLFLLKDRLYTKTGRDIANERHAYMEDFIKQFLAEWDGKR